MSAAPDLPLSFEPAPLADGALELIADGTMTPLPGIAGSWRPGSLGEADWCLSKYAEAAQELARLDAHAAESHARIDAWRAQAGKRAERTRTFFEGHLKAYAASQRTERSATLFLPSGSVTSRASKAKVVVADEAAAVEWARDNAPAAVQVKESILLGPLRKATAIQPLMVAEHLRLHLVCGHTDTIVNEDPPAVGSEWPCLDCEYGTFPKREILKVETEPVYVPTVFGPDGEAVPETVLAVEAEHVEFTVKPDL